MAYPDVRVNNSTGSDTQASGAGPSIAVFGNGCWAKGTRAGLSTTDLTGVVTDGSAALWTDAPLWKRITGVKNTEQAVTGNTTAGSPIITNITSTAGMTAGDLIYSGVAGTFIIVSVDSTSQITVDGNAFATGIGTAIVCPRQVTVHSSFSGTVFFTGWAIGGKRATLNNAGTRKVFDTTNGGEFGWSVTVEYTGINYTLTSVLSLDVNGIRFRGSGVVRPIIQQTVSGAACLTGINYSYDQTRCTWLHFIHTHATTKGPGFNGNTGYWHFVDCIFGSWTSSERLTYGVFSVTNNHQNSSFFNCSFINCINQGFYQGGGFNHMELFNCVILGCGAGIRANGAGLRLHDCLIARNGGDGVLIFGQTLEILRSTIANNNGDGVELLTYAGNYSNVTLIGSIIANHTGWGISGGDDLRRVAIKSNVFYGNNLGDSSVLTVTDDLSNTNPAFTDPTNAVVPLANFNPGSHLKNAGWPTYQSGTKGGVGVGATQDYWDLGGVQAAGGLILMEE